MLFLLFIRRLGFTLNSDRRRGIPLSGRRLADAEGADHSWQSPDHQQQRRPTLTQEVPQRQAWHQYDQKETWQAAQACYTGPYETTQEGKFHFISSILRKSELNHYNFKFENVGGKPKSYSRTQAVRHGLKTVSIVPVVGFEPRSQRWKARQETTSRVSRK